MNDPYKVLGVPSSATDDEVKQAYRNLARKYHPDNYINNPLADLATEKMKEINEAYDTIQHMRKSGSNNYGSGYNNYGGYNGSATSSQFSDIRRLIASGRTSEAEELLDGTPSGQRDAEWFYLKGVIAYNRGWTDSAYQYFATACNKNPTNQEYRAAFDRLNYQRQNMQGFGRPNAFGGMSCCDMCATIYCANCCCDCCGNAC